MQTGFYPTPTFDELVLTMPSECLELVRLYGHHAAGLRQDGDPRPDLQPWSLPVPGQVVRDVGDGDDDVIEAVVVDTPAAGVSEPLAELIPRTPPGLDMTAVRARMQARLSGGRR